MRFTASTAASASPGISGDRNIKLLHQVNILYNLLPTAQWIHLSAVLLIFGLLFRHVDLLLLTAWLGFALLIMSARILINNYYRRSSKSAANAEYWFNWFLVGTTLYGILWSATAILLVPAYDPMTVGLTALIVSGLAAGGVAVSSVSLKVFVVYASSTMWPYAAFLLSSGQEPHATIGLMILAFFFLITALAYHVNRFFTRLIDLQLKTHMLEKEVKQEGEKRRFMEKALLDNTLEEGIADLIRNHSRVLKEKRTARMQALESGSGDDSGSSEEQKLMYYIQLLNETVLSNIKSALVFLKNFEGSTLNDAQKKNVQILEKILHEARSAIEKSFGEAGESEAVNAQAMLARRPEKINLRRLLIYITHEIPLFYKAKYITIQRKIDKLVPRSVLGHREAVEQIFRQLLMNAFRYSDGGTININIDVESQSEDEIELRFTISDTGVGIPADVVEYLENESSDVDMDSGLGTVKKLLRALDGSISVRSTLGVGSTVTVNLRFDKVEEESEITGLESY